MLLRLGEGTLWLKCDILPTTREGGRGLHWVEMYYNAMKIKGAVRLYCNGDPAIQTVWEFEEQAEEMGLWRNLVKRKLEISDGSEV